MIDKNEVIDVLKQCYDPEIPIDLWSLGLIYDITIDKSNAYTAAQADGDYRNKWFFYQQAVPDQTGLNALLAYIDASTDDYNFSGLDNPTDEKWCYLYGTGSSGSGCDCTYISCDSPYVLDLSEYAIETI